MSQLLPMLKQMPSNHKINEPMLIISTNRRFVVSLVLACFSFFALLSLLSFLNTPKKRVEEKNYGSGIAIEQKRLTQKQMRMHTPIQKKIETQKKSLKAPDPINFTSLSSDFGNSFGLKVGSLALENSKDKQNHKGALQELNEAVVDIPPLVKNRPVLKYPPQAKNKGIGGYVTLNFLVDTRGKIERSEILKSEPQGIFDEVVLQSVPLWEFQPAVHQGAKVKVWAQQTIRFALDE